MLPGEVFFMKVSFERSIEKRKSAILEGVSSSLNRVKSERPGKGVRVKKGLVVIIRSG
jgi:hypothetical protein